MRFKVHSQRTTSSAWSCQQPAHWSSPLEAVDFEMGWWSLRGHPQVSELYTERNENITDLMGVRGKMNSSAIPLRAPTATATFAMPKDPEADGALDPLDGFSMTPRSLHRRSCLQPKPWIASASVLKARCVAAHRPVCREGHMCSRSHGNHLHLSSQRRLDGEPLCNLSCVRPSWRSMNWNLHAHHGSKPGACQALLNANPLSRVRPQHLCQ